MLNLARIIHAAPTTKKQIKPPSRIDVVAATVHIPRDVRRRIEALVLLLMPADFRGDEDGLLLLG